jgi:hypothetical protein
VELFMNSTEERAFNTSGMQAGSRQHHPSAIVRPSAALQMLKRLIPKYAAAVIVTSQRNLCKLHVPECGMHCCRAVQSFLLLPGGHSFLRGPTCSTKQDSAVIMWLSS